MTLSIFFLGTVIGSIFTSIVFRLFLVGTLRIDSSDPFDGPYMFLELSKEVKSVTNKAYVVLKVRNENFSPRK